MYKNDDTDLTTYLNKRTILKSKYTHNVKGYLYMCVRMCYSIIYGAF